MQHAYGRLFYFLVRSVVSGSHNGELEKAFKTLEAVEAKKKELDREVIAESGHDY